MRSIFEVGEMEDVDMVLLIQSGTMVEGKVAEAVSITFDRRKAHALPRVLQQPPTGGQKPYDALARECGLIDGAFAILDTYLSEGGSVEVNLRKS
jgi:hypothetical protein